MWRCGMQGCGCKSCGWRAGGVAPQPHRDDRRIKYSWNRLKCVCNAMKYLAKYFGIRLKCKIVSQNKLNPTSEHRYISQYNLWKFSQARAAKTNCKCDLNSWAARQIKRFNIISGKTRNTEHAQAGKLLLAVSRHKLRLQIMRICLYLPRGGPGAAKGQTISP